MAEEEKEFRSRDPLGRLFDLGPTSAERKAAKRRLADQGKIDPEEYDEIPQRRRGRDFLNQLFGDLTGQKTSDDTEGI